MKYKSRGTRAGHKIFIRKRETAFDKKVTPKTNSSASIENHTEMNTYEYAAFQKKLFEKKAKEKRNKRILILFTCIVLIAIYFAIPYIYNFIFDPKFLPERY